MDFISIIARWGYENSLRGDEVSQWNALDERERAEWHARAEKLLAENGGPFHNSFYAVATGIGEFIENHSRPGSALFNTKESAQQVAHDIVSNGTRDGIYVHEVISREITFYAAHRSVERYDRDETASASEETPA